MQKTVQKPGPDIGCRRPGPQPGALPLVALASTFLLAACAGGVGQRSDTGFVVTPKLAEAALRAGVPDIALHLADVLLVKDPRNVRALVARGNALSALHDPAGAVRSYRAALAVDPETSAARLGLGRVLIHVNPAAAEAAFLDVATREPGSLAAWNNIGIARDLQGRHGDAQIAYRRALAVAPEAADVAGNLGLSLALSGQAGEAVALLRPLAAAPGAPAMVRKNLEVAERAPQASAPARQSAEAEVPAVPHPAARPMVTAEPEPAQTAIGQTVAATTADGPARRSQAPELPVLVVAELVRALPADSAMTTVATPFPPAAAAPAQAVSAKATTPPDVSDAEPRPAGPAKASSASAAPDVSTTSQNGVQLAAYMSERRAWLAWNEWRGRLGPLLESWKPSVAAADSHGRTYWRLRVDGFADATAARDFCSGLLASGWPDCWAVSHHPRRKG